MECEGCEMTDVINVLGEFSSHLLIVSLLVLLGLQSLNYVALTFLEWLRNRRRIENLYLKIDELEKGEADE